MNQVVIREYCESDWLACCTIHDKARPIEMDGSCDPKAFVPLAEEKSDLDNFHQSSKYVASVDNTVIGFVGTLKGEVTWLYVDPKLSHRRIGRQLLKKGLSIMSGRKSTYVLEGNNNAKKLYESEGFEIASCFDSDNNGYPCTVLKLASHR